MKKVLLVDDDQDILDALGLALEESYEVIRARNGAEALRTLENVRVDGIVLDLMMPVMNGGDFLRALRARGDRTPVLVASAGTDLRARSAEIGADAWIAKPFEIGELEAQLARLLDEGGPAGGGSGWPPGGSKAPLGAGGHSSPTACA